VKRTLYVLLAVALVATACGESDGNTSTSATTDSEATQQPTSTAPPASDPPDIDSFSTEIDPGGGSAPHRCEGNVPPIDREDPTGLWPFPREWTAIGA